MTKTLQELKDEAIALDIELTGNETRKQLIALLNEVDEDDSKEVVKEVESNPSDDYKKVASDGVFPVRPLTAKAFNMASVIAAQPKTTTIVPLKDEETIGGSFHVWQENGFKIHVLKGIAVQLPQQVAKAITDEYTNTARATREVLIRNPITGELVNMNSDQRSETDRARFGA